MTEKPETVTSMHDPFGTRTREHLLVDQMAVLKLTGWLHAIDCPLIDERGWATVCSCKPVHESANV